MTPVRMGLVALLIVSPLPANADGIDDLEARLKGRVGTYSEDRRVNDFELRTPLGPGPRTGCHGDTVNASVTIVDVQGQLHGILCNTHD